MNPAQSNKQEQDDALVMIALRNAFYKKKFYWILNIYFLSLIVIAVLIGALIYLVKNPTHPLYFVTDSVGRLIQDTPRNLPNMSTDEVANWAIEGITAAYSYDFVNYRAQLQSAQKYFTEYGWRSYMNGLTKSNNLLALNQRKLIFIAQVVDKPKLLVEGILGGAYAWKFQLPLLVTYLMPPYDEKSKFQNPLILTVVVQRQSILSSYKGLGIVQSIGNLAMAPPTQNLNAPSPTTPAT